MLQTTIALSAWSRITSNSISFIPAMLCSINTWVTGERVSPLAAIFRSSVSSLAIPPPVPPIVNAGRTITGKPLCLAKSTASATVVAIAESGTGSPSSFINDRNRSRSSAWSIASNLVPNSSIFSSFKIPDSANSIAMLSPCWPPRVGKMASGRSLRMIWDTNCRVSGSI